MIQVNDVAISSCNWRVSEVTSCNPVRDINFWWGREWDSHTQLNLNLLGISFTRSLAKKGMRDGQDLGSPQIKTHDKSLLLHEVPGGDICRRGKAKQRNTIYYLEIQPKCNFLVSWVRPKSKDLLKLPWNVPLSSLFLRKEKPMGKQTNETEETT